MPRHRRIPRSRGLAVLALAAGSLAAPASASALTVSAAASLRDAFPAIDASPKYSFAGSDALALQIRIGAPRRRVRLGQPLHPDPALQGGPLLEAGGLRHQLVVMIVPTANPAGINSVFDLRKAAQAPRHRLARRCRSASTPARCSAASASAVRCASTPSAPRRNVTSVAGKVRARRRRRRLRLRHRLAARRANGVKRITPARSSPSRRCATACASSSATGGNNAAAERVHQASARPRRTQALRDVRLRRPEAAGYEGAPQSAVRTVAFNVLLTPVSSPRWRSCCSRSWRSSWRRRCGTLLDLLATAVARDAMSSRSRRTSSRTSLILAFGTPAAYLLATRRFRGRALVLTLIELPLVLPPAVAGIGLLAAFGADRPDRRPARGRGFILPFTEAGGDAGHPVRGLAVLPAPGDRRRSRASTPTWSPRHAPSAPARPHVPAHRAAARARAASAPAGRWRSPAGSASSARRSCSPATSRPSPRPCRWPSTSSSRSTSTRPGDRRACWWCSAPRSCSPSSC